MTPNGEAPASLGERLSYPRFAQRIRRRYPAEMTLLPAGLPDREAIASVCAALQAGGTPLAAALRITRQLVLERLLCLDCAGEASMPQVTGAMTAPEVFLSDTHPAPNSGASTTESPPGTYVIGPVKFDEAGTILLYNRYEARMSRLPPERVVGRGFFLDIAPCTRVDAFQGRFRALVNDPEKQGDSFAFKSTLLHSIAGLTDDLGAIIDKKETRRRCILHASSEVM